MYTDTHLTNTKEGYKKNDSYFPHGKVFGGVLVAPHTDWYVIVDVRVASPSAKPASDRSLHHHNDVWVSSSIALMMECATGAAKVYTSQS